MVTNGANTVRIFWVLNSRVYYKLYTLGIGGKDNFKERHTAVAYLGTEQRSLGEFVHYFRGIFRYFIS